MTPVFNDLFTDYIKQSAERSTDQLHHRCAEAEPGPGAVRGHGGQPALLRQRNAEPIAKRHARQVVERRGAQGVALGCGNESSAKKRPMRLTTGRARQAAPPV